MMYEYTATLDRVIDGDTVVLNVDLGFHMKANLTFRLLGINAPEMHGVTHDKGQAAKDFLIDLLKGVTKLNISTHDQDKYGRWLADISFVDVAGDVVNVNQRILKEGHAVEMIM